MGGRGCDAVSVDPVTGRDIVGSVATTSATVTADSGTTTESGSAGSRPSKSGSKITRGRRTAKATSTPTPLGADLPTIREKVSRMLGTEDGESEMLDMIKHDLLTNYILEVQAGQDGEMNPQHSRASRKQSKEIAELLIQLTKHG